MHACRAPFHLNSDSIQRHADPPGSRRSPTHVPHSYQLTPADTTLPLQRPEMPEDILTAFLIVLDLSELRSSCSRKTSTANPICTSALRRFAESTVRHRFQGSSLNREHPATDKHGKRPRSRSGFKGALVIPFLAATVSRLAASALPIPHAHTYLPSYPPHPVSAIAFSTTLSAATTLKLNNGTQI